MTGSPFWPPQSSAQNDLNSSISKAIPSLLPHRNNLPLPSLMSPSHQQGLDTWGLVTVAGGNTKVFEQHLNSAQDGEVWASRGHPVGQEADPWWGL